MTLSPDHPAAATILVTGATGFVGTRACQILTAQGFSVISAVRAGHETATTRPVGELGPQTDWTAALREIDAVVHLAGRAHVMRETTADPLAQFRRVNRDATLRLAEQAAERGIKRLLFISSIKVNGEVAPPGQPFRADDAAAPLDPYGRSKAEAEDGLRGIAARTGLDVTILRPPLIHGPGAKGNLAALMRLLSRRPPLPLPLGAIHNRRSLVGLDNLGHAMGFLLRERAAAGQTYLIRDGEDVSTSELIRLLGNALDAPPRLLPIPSVWLRWGAALLGKKAAADRLLGSLCVDDGPLRALGWRPPVALKDGLAAMAAAFRSGRA